MEIPAHYKTLLCAVDFDENSIAALTHAKYLAGRLDAPLHVLHVVPLPAVGEVVRPVEPVKDTGAYDKLRAMAERELPGIKHELHLRVAYRSEIAESILETANELHADLLVVATHGRSGIKHMFLGSVAEELVRRASCPVLTVRPV